MDLEEVAAVLRTCKCCTRQVPVSYPPLPPLADEPQPSLKKLSMPPTTPFTKLLFQREYVLIVNELLALREDLIGSKALIHMVAAGKKPAELSSAIACTPDFAWPIFWRVHAYVREAAWADSGLRYLGLLPKVEDVRIVSYVKALMAKEMDWSEFWEYIDRERKEGSLKGNAAWADPQGALRTRVQRTLKGLNTKFIDLVGMHNGIALFMEDDYMRCMSQDMIDESSFFLRPPPGPARATWSSTSGLPLGFLEHLHSQGQLMRGYLGRFAREAGNHYYKKFIAATREAAREDLSVDVLLEYSISRRVPEQAAMTCANMAALYLEMKNYPEAMSAAEQGIGAVVNFKAEPVSYAARRALTIEQLHTGVLYHTPKTAYRAQTKAEQEAENLLLRKLWLRKARAEAAQCLLKLRAQAVPRLTEETKYLRNEARHGFQACHLMDPSDSTARKEGRQFLEALDSLLGRDNARIR